MNVDIAHKYLDTSSVLLEKFKTAAPGTFAHCVNVMNLCEMIAKDIDLDADRLKIAALYHDIGKMVNPTFFSENISGSNIHDSLDPATSYQYLSRHISDAMLILVQETDMLIDMPEVLDIISRHHGDSVLYSMFNKCPDSQEHDFRYKSKKPQCPYSAVLMIVDSVEAMAKSLYNSGKLNTSEDKQRVVDMKLEQLDNDDQLDVLKMGVFKKIKQRLVRELDSIYHPRVSYEEKPEQSEESE